MLNLFTDVRYRNIDKSTGQFLVEESDEMPISIIKPFWERHICTFKISHGTTSLFHRHFLDHGISPSYPRALENTIAKIRSVWANHESDICEKTGYFKGFEERYDRARKNNEITVSFSAQETITQEYTTGARHCGEWVRELRSFLSEASYKKNVLSADDEQTLLETESLIDVMSSVPPMIVKISAGCPRLNHVFGSHSILGPLDEFIKYVKLHCEGWQDPNTLLGYMNTTLLPQLEAEKERLREVYEFTVVNEIPAEHLEFEFIKQPGCRTAPIPTDYPKLEFNIPKKLSGLDIGKLQIKESGFSDIEEYQDSIFKHEFSIEGYSMWWTVTRKPRTKENDKTVMLEKQKKEMRENWVRVFGCESLMNEV